MTARPGQTCARAPAVPNATRQVFETDPRVVGYDCCLNCIVGCSSTGITCLFCPIGVCCPGWLYPLYSLKVRRRV